MDPKANATQRANAPGPRREADRARSTDPTISIVLPTHNGARFIDRAVGSVVSQTRTDWELLIVDDASTDDTPQHIAAWTAKDARIRGIRLDRNHKLPAALNHGFRLARGKYFTWTSDDNEFDSGALERLARELDGDPAVDVVYSDYRFVDPDGTELDRAHARAPEWLVTGNCVGACFLYRREVDRALGGYDETCFLAEDYDFWLRASLRFGFRPLNESMYDYRVHADSLTSRRPGEVEAMATVAVDRHLAALPRGLRGRQRVRAAIADFAHQRPGRGRRRLLQAIGDGRIPVLHTGFRWVLLDALLGKRRADRLRQLARNAA